MKRYREKPIVIEALELRWDNWSEMCDFADVGRLSDGKPEGGQDGQIILLNIPIPEGLKIARQGDFIIKGIMGELRSCKSDIFEATYEPVPE